MAELTSLRPFCRVLAISIVSCSFVVTPAGAMSDDKGYFDPGPVRPGAANDYDGRDDKGNKVPNYGCPPLDKGGKKIPPNSTLKGSPLPNGEPNQTDKNIAGHKKKNAEGQDTDELDPNYLDYFMGEWHFVEIGYDLTVRKWCINKPETPGHFHDSFTIEIITSRRGTQNPQIGPRTAGWPKPT